jgi:hypothetical protein
MFATNPLYGAQEMDAGITTRLFTQEINQLIEMVRGGRRSQRHGQALLLATSPSG